MTVLVAVQARTGSTRLPGKVLEEVHGLPMLRFEIERLRAGLPPTWDLAIATTDSPGDDAVVELADGADVEVFRGSEHDVLARYEALAASKSPTSVVRLTGDCPLIDPALVQEVVALHETSGASYTSNVYPRSYPKGLDVEVISPSALLAAAAEATDVVEREHVTPFIVRRPERFVMATLFSGEDAGDEHWTVDLPEDLEHVRQIVGRLDDPIGDSWQTILQAVGRAASDPTEIRFEPQPPPPPGSSPWTRSWTARLDGSSLGEVWLTVGDGRSTVSISDTDQREEIETAFMAFVSGDVQITR